MNPNYQTTAHKGQHRSSSYTPFPLSNASQTTNDFSFTLEQLDNPKSLL